MTQHPPPDRARDVTTCRGSLPLLLALIAAGVGGNFLSFPLFLNVDFLFGSIFALLAVQRFGLGRGVIAGALISAYTITLWNHPYACIILTAEVAVVGWLFPRRRIGLVLADTLYWLCIGMPLVYVFYHGRMHVPTDSVGMVMTKQAVNGIVNALIARLLFAGYTLLARTQLLPLREIVSTLFGLFVLCPALIILALDSRADFASIDQRIRNALLHDSAALSDSLRSWLENRKTPIVALARMAATLPPQQMQARLEQARAADHNFLRVGLLDEQATTVAFAPLLDELGKANLGKNYADRPFIPLLKEHLQPMASEVIISRVGPPQPVVHMLAPVVKNSAYAGYVVGALNLDRIEKILKMTASREGQLFILLDRNHKIITTNDPDQKVMTDLTRGAGQNHPLEEGISQWIPELPDRTPSMERWKKSYYVAQTRINDHSDWTLILEQPIAPFQKQLYATYTRKLTLLFLTLLGALFLAEFLSRLITRTNEELRTITSDLPLKLAEGQPVLWPQSAILETHHLIVNFREMADTLSTQFRDIRSINTTLEERVATRTRELQESRDRYDLALLGSQDGIWDWNVQTHAVYFSARWFEMLGYTPDEYEPTYDLFVNLVHPDDRKTIRERIRWHLEQGTPYSVEFRMLRKDGTYGWILARGQAMRNAQGEALRMAGSHTDITARMQLERSLHASNLLLKRTFASLNEAIFIVETGTRKILDCNVTVEKMFGYSHDELLGASTACLHVSEEMSRRFGSEMLRAYADKGFYETTFQMQRKDGSIFDSEHSVTPIHDDQGHIVSHVCVVRDISGRKETERERELFFKFFQTSADMMCLADPNGAFIRTNPACSEILGYSEAELVAQPFMAFIHPDDQQATLEEMARQQQSGSTFNFENRYLCKDGSIRWLAWRASYLAEEGVTYATARDITARKEAEEQMLRSLREKVVLLKEIHHRVKNNLQIVHSLLTLQANGIADPEVRAQFEEGRDRVGTMALIHEKLYNSEDLSHIDFKDYLRSLLLSIAETFSRREIELVVEMEPLALDINSGIPCGLIVNELVSNSFKYAFPARQPGRITIGLRPEGGELLLTVADNGIGFPQDLDFRNTRSLGLQLVSILTVQLRGTIELERATGTRFCLRFPGPTP